MTIMTDDGKMAVGVGGSAILFSLYSTAKVRIKMSGLRVSSALDFLRTGECDKRKLTKTLNQLKIVKAEMSAITPDEAVYDCNNRSEKAPWENNISESVHSCMELFTTDEGDILIDRLIDLLEYAIAAGVSVVLP